MAPRPVAVQREPAEQPSEIKGIPAAVRRAVAWHPAIRQAKTKIRQQDEILADARSGYFPSIGGGISLGQDNGGKGSLSPIATASATQMLYDFGKVSGRVKAETAISKVRRAEYLTAIDDIVRDTLLASIEMMRNRNLVMVAKDQLADTKAIQALVDSRTDKGASTRSDKLQAEARAQAAEAAALEFTVQESRWRTSLSALLGAAVATDLGRSLPVALKTSCSGPQPDWEAVPEMVAAKARAEEADARIGLARATMLPTLALEAKTDMDLFGNGQSPHYFVGLKVTTDFYNGGSMKARQKAASYAAEASQAGVAAAGLDIRKSWSESRSQVVGLEALLASLRARQAMMRETRELYQRQFLDLGTRTLLDLLNAVEELHAARFDEINKSYDLYKLNLDCAYAAGTLRQQFGVEPSEQEAETGPAGRDA